MTALEALAAPLLCGPLGDLNRDPVCRRARRIYAAIASVEDVDRTAAEAARARNPRRRAGLERWVATIGAERVELYRRVLADLPACTHPAGERAELSLADALPGCTC